MSIETQLREALVARADELTPTTGDAYARVSSAVRTSVRRRRAAYAGAAAVLLATAVLVPALWPATDRGSTPATRTTRVQLPGPTDRAWTSYGAWPVRGSLGGDRALVEAMERRSSSRVLYAGDVGERRTVVTWAEGTARLFAGPRGAAAEELPEVGEAPPAVDDAITVLVAQRTGATLLALSVPRAGSLQVSPTVRIGTDGSVTRSWSSATIDRDGTAKVSLPTVATYATRVRLGSFDGPPTMVDPGDPKAVDPEASICLNCPVDELRAKGPRSISSSIGLSLGLEPDSITTREVWFGPVDREVAAAAGMTDISGGDVGATLYVANSVLPDGAVLRTSMVVASARDGSSAQTVEVESGVPVDAATADNRPVVIRGIDQKHDETVVQVFAPNAARVALTSDAPTVFPSAAPKAVVAGSATFRLSGTTGADHLEVVGYDDAGREQGRWPLELANADDPYDVRP